MFTTHTSLSVVSSLFSSVKESMRKGTKVTKALRNEAHKLGLKPTDSSWEGRILENDLDTCETLSFAATAEEINEVYRQVGRSCMRNKEVGGFYSSIGVECAVISGARALVSPQEKTFYRVYGENHYALRSLLILLGYKESIRWLSDTQIVLIEEIRNKVIILDSEIEDYLVHVRKTCSLPYIEELIEQALYDLSIAESEEGVVLERPGHFLQLSIEENLVEIRGKEYELPLKYSPYWVSYRKEQFYMPSVDGISHLE